MQKVRPFLWFDDNAEEAMNFYLSIFKNGEALNVGRDADSGKVTSVTFRIEDKSFWPSTAARTSGSTRPSRFSSRVNRRTRSTTSGSGSRRRREEPLRLAQRQVRPLVASDTLGPERAARRPDPQKSERVWQAMMQMSKIDIAALKQAYAG